MLHFLLREKIFKGEVFLISQTIVSQTMLTSISDVFYWFSIGWPSIGHDQTIKIDLYKFLWLSQITNKNFSACQKGAKWMDGGACGKPTGIKWSYQLWRLHRNLFWKVSIHRYLSIYTNSTFLAVIILSKRCTWTYEPDARSKIPFRFILPKMEKLFDLTILLSNLVNVSWSDVDQNTIF